MTKRLFEIILVVLFGIRFQPLASASVLQLEAQWACNYWDRPNHISQGRWQEKCPGGGHEIVELWSNSTK